MLKQQDMTGDKRNIKFSLWERMTLITAVLLSGGSLAALAPSQLAYASSKRPHTHYYTRHKRHSTSTNTIKMLVVCQSGNGGKGGSTTENSSGADGGPGGNCIITIPISLSLTA